MVDKIFTIGARVVLFCDTIESNSGWITTNGGGQLLIDDPSFPNVIHCEVLQGGGGVTERWIRKDIGTSISGDVKFEFFFDFTATSLPGVSSQFSIFLQEGTAHPDVSTGSKIGCSLSGTNHPIHQLFGVVSDGVTTTTSIQSGGTSRTTHVYPDNFEFPPIIEAPDPFLLGPYFVTVELKDGKFRMSLFKDPQRTIHARGSPREVDATGINPTNLRFITIANCKGCGSGRKFTGDLDDIYVTQNEPLPPLAVKGVVNFLFEDWESYTPGDENPNGWTSATILDENNGGVFDPATIDIKEVSTEDPDDGSQSFHIHTKYKHLSASGFSGSTFMTTSVLSEEIPTPNNPDGGELLIPYSFIARLKSIFLTITGSTKEENSSGFYIVYNTLEGIIGGASNNKKLIGYKLFKDNGPPIIQSGVFNLFDGIVFQPVSSTDINVGQQDLPDGSYVTLINDFQQSLHSDLNAGLARLDFESHVKSIQVGFWTSTNAFSFGDKEVEAELFGDSISIIEQGVIQKGFNIDSHIRAKIDKTFIIDGELIFSQTKEFIIDAIAGIEKNKGFSVNSRIIKRDAVNNVTPDALIQQQGNVKNFIIDGLPQSGILENYEVDSLISDQGIKFTCADGLVKELDKTSVFAVDSQLLQLTQSVYIIDGLPQAQGDDGNNGGSNPFVTQPVDDNDVPIPLGTLVGQRLTLPSAPIKITSIQFILHRDGLSGSPVGTLTGKIFRNVVPGGAILVGDLIDTSDNVVSVSSITTDTAGGIVTFTFSSGIETTPNDEIFLGFDIVGSNEVLSIHTESTGTALPGGDLIIEQAGSVWGSDLGVDTTLNVIIDATVQQRGSALINAKIRFVNQNTFSIDGIAQAPLEFTIDGLAVLPEQESILFVESVIGRSI